MGPWKIQMFPKGNKDYWTISSHLMIGAYGMVGFWGMIVLIILDCNLSFHIQTITLTFDCDLSQRHFGICAELTMHSNSQRAGFFLGLCQEWLWPVIFGMVPGFSHTHFPGGASCEDFGVLERFQVVCAFYKTRRQEGNANVDSGPRIHKLLNLMIVRITSQSSCNLLPMFSRVFQRECPWKLRTQLACQIHGHRVLLLRNLRAEVTGEVRVEIISSLKRGRYSTWRFW